MAPETPKKIHGFVHHHGSRLEAVAIRREPRSLDQPAFAEVVQDQLVERVLVGGEDVSDSALGAPVLETADEGVQVVLVAFQERGADGDLGDVVVLGIDQAEVADELGLDLLAATGRG